MRRDPARRRASPYDNRRTSVTGAPERDATEGGGGSVWRFCALEVVMVPISAMNTATEMTETSGADVTLIEGYS